MSLFKSILLLVCAALSQMTVAQTSPVPMLEQVAHEIIGTLKDNKSSLKTNPDIVYRAVEINLLPHVDISGMSRSVLGRQAWLKATPSERTAFSRAFTRLVVRTYSNPLSNYSDETIQFLPIRGSLASRFIRVNSVVVRSEGQNIPLSYSLISQNGQWKVYDMSVEGVSLLQSFRTQFAQELQHLTVTEVIKKMQQRV